VATERHRVIVIGGGVIGCAILWELARRGIRGLLLEAEPDIGEGTSKANSGIVHTGFDSHPGTLEAAMLRAARPLWPDLVEALGVPFLSVGAIMLARDDEEAGRLRTVVAANARAMGVDVELLDRRTVHGLAPFLATTVVAGLSIPGESVLDPFWLTRGYAEAAIAGGAEVRVRHQVVDLELQPDAVVVHVEGAAAIEAEQVIDAAGLRADEVARMAGDETFTISPRQGQFLVSEEAFGVDRVVLPIPGPAGKGMLVTPIVFGGLLLGPTARDSTDKDDNALDPTTRERILEAGREMVPALREAVPVRQFAGLRHVSSTGDFIIRPSARSDRVHIVAGIRSTGISTSPAIAATVVADVAARRGWILDERPRKLSPVATSFADEPGEVVCLCRSITRAEVVSAVRRPTPAATLDAVKRRAGALFGDCQGNMCALDVARIVSEQRKVPVTAVEQHRRGTWLWREGRGSVDGGGTALVDAPRTLPSACDVVVIGGGVAGRAAADAIANDLRVLLLERSPRRDGQAKPVAGWTAIGLVPDGDAWTVLAQSTLGTAEVAASAVIVATGAYGMPAEQRPIAGPRLVGLVTDDAAWRALDAGLLLGSHVVVIGAGKEATRLTAALSGAGAAVTRQAETPLEVRGSTRLEAIRTSSGWIEADTVVFADDHLAQNFLLRGLGLVDGVAGRTAPADADGRLPLPGLWAAGCCVDPDRDHGSCAAAGAAVGRLVVASLHRERDPLSERAGR